MGAGTAAPGVAAAVACLPSPWAPKISSGTPITSRMAPAASRPAAIGPKSSDRNPACRSARMSGLASAFIITTDQFPGSIFQSSSCSPDPEAEVAQKSCPDGRGGCCAPCVSRYSTWKGRKLTSSNSE